MSFYDNHGSLQTNLRNNFLPTFRPDAPVILRAKCEPGVRVSTIYILLTSASKIAIQHPGNYSPLSQMRPLPGGAHEDVLS